MQPGHHKRIIRSGQSNKEWRLWTSDRWHTQINIRNTKQIRKEDLIKINRHHYVGEQHRKENNRRPYIQIILR